MSATFFAKQHSGRFAGKGPGHFFRGIFHAQQACPLVGWHNVACSQNNQTCGVTIETAVLPTDENYGCRLIFIFIVRGQRPRDDLGYV